MCPESLSCSLVPRLLLLQRSHVARPRGTFSLAPQRLCCASTAGPSAARLAALRCKHFASQSILNPCQSCRSNSASYYFVSAQFATKILYPIIRMPMNVTAEKTIVALRVNVSAVGVIYCTALTQGAPLTSALTVQQSGFRQTILAPGSVEVLVSGLSPSTDYALYCFTQDFNGHAMTLAAVAATATNVSTRCCHAMQYSSFPPTIYEYANVSAASSSVFEFTLDASPSATTVVILNLAGFLCSWSAGSSLPVKAVAVPSRFSFAHATLALSGSFIVQGSPGCYNLTVSVASGQHYDSASHRHSWRGQLFVTSQPTNNAKCRLFRRWTKSNCIIRLAV